jgi:UrcA family protein
MGHMSLEFRFRRSSRIDLQISLSFSINGDAVSEANPSKPEGKHPMTRLIFSSLALAAALVSAAPAFAQDEPSVAVKYGDLNLNSAMGAQAFHQRLKAAVIAVCGEPDRRDPAYAPFIVACQNQAWAKAAKAERQAIAEAGQAKLAVAMTQQPGR